MSWSVVVKPCTGCKKDLPLDSFSANNSSGTWHKRYSICKKCKAKRDKDHYQKNRPRIREAQYWRQLKYYYGLEREDCLRMLKEQDGLCAICGGNQTRGRRLAVDHCHDTGKVRGLLCDLCNRGLGYYKHEPELLRKAARYLDV